MSQGEHEGMSVVCWFVEMLHVSVGYARQHTCCVRAVTQHERLRPYYRQGRIYVNKLLRQGVHIHIYSQKKAGSRARRAKDAAAASVAGGPSPT